MKRLFIHIGTHKTASTTFQRICFGFKNLLLKNNIVYPELEDYPGINNHAPIAWHLDQLDKLEGQHYLEKILNTPLSTQCSTTLLSSEDFENMLINHNMLEKIEEIAQKLGFCKVELVVVTRDSKNYLKSIYNQLSKHGAVLDYPTIARSAEKTGYFTCSLSHFNYYFAIKPRPFIDELKKKFPKIIIHHYNYDEFTETFAGKVFISKLLPEEAVKLIETFDLKKHQILSSNESMTELEVETQYAINALRINTSETTISKNYLHLIEQIARHRLERNNLDRDLVDSLFENNL